MCVFFFFYYFVLYLLLVGLVFLVLGILIVLCGVWGSFFFYVILVPSYLVYDLFHDAFMVMTGRDRDPTADMNRAWWWFLFLEKFLVSPVFIRVWGFVRKPIVVVYKYIADVQRQNSDRLVELLEFLAFDDLVNKFVFDGLLKIFYCRPLRFIITLPIIFFGNSLALFKSYKVVYSSFLYV